MGKTKTTDGSRLSGKLPPGRPHATHGGYSFLTKGELPEGRDYIRRYLTAARAGLIQDLGPTEKNLTTAQLIIIDGLVTKLGVVRCIEEHIRENSVMRGHDLAPSLKTSYLAYKNSIRLDLQALGVNKRTQGRVLTALEKIKEEYEREEKARSGAKVD